MPNSRNDDWIACAATTAIVAAFGTVFLLPALKTFSDKILLWWLFYVLATAMAVGIGKNPVVGLRRLLIAAIPGLMPALYIGFRLMLGHTVYLSGLNSKNPIFWAAVTVTVLATWFFTWLFSHARVGLKAGLRRLMRDAPEKQINALSRTLTAVIGLLGVIGILVTKLMPA
jgi:hypothetical protein